MNDDLAAAARAILDTNLYLTLGTADRDGRPWACPVYYATADYTDFYWVSAPDTTHSRNIAERPQVSLVVFDSRVPPYSGKAVYLSGTATELAGAELNRGFGDLSGSTRTRCRDRDRRRRQPNRPLAPIPGHGYRTLHHVPERDRTALLPPRHRRRPPRLHRLPLRAPGPCEFSLHE